MAQPLRHSSNSITMEQIVPFFFLIWANLNGCCPLMKRQAVVKKWCFSLCISQNQHLIQSRTGGGSGSRPSMQGCQHLHDVSQCGWHAPGSTVQHESHFHIKHARRTDGPARPHLHQQAEESEKISDLQDENKNTEAHNLQPSKSKITDLPKDAAFMSVIRQVTAKHDTKKAVKEIGYRENHAT